MQSVFPDKTIIIDSSSSDDTVKIAESYGLEVIQIDKKDFNHGDTRQLAFNKLNGFEIVVYFTQDAILSDKDSLKKIVTVFHDPSIGAAYGRQLPRDQAGVFEYYERYFNYPCHSLKKEFSDRNIYGVKTPFISNSFAAYRVKALQEVGGFPSDVIMAEDMYVAAKMLMAGWSVYYCADATVYHSHDYSLKQLFSRYFDTGVFHNRERWIQENFGSAGGEGIKYIIKEMNYLWRNRPMLIPYSFIRNTVKWLGYHIGSNERVIPLRIKKILSMHTSYWD